MEGRSSFFSSFLLPKLLSGRMTLKVIVVLCLVLVGLLEANPVGMEGVKDNDSGIIGDPMSEDNFGSGEQVEDMNQAGDSGEEEEEDPRSDGYEFLERKKRARDDNNCGCGAIRMDSCGR